jgi:drug/metabolite transporter (DMT)-like permease
MEYSWVLLSLISAFSLATSDAFVKKSLQRGDEYLVALSRLLFTLPLLFILLVTPVPALDKTCYWAFFTALPLELFTIVLYTRALKLSPMSLTLPFLSLTPLSLILISYLLLGEKVSLRGAIGIFLIAAGSYVLNIGKVRKGLFEPFRVITKEKGPLLMIAVALLYGITSALGKMAIEHSSALFFAATYSLGICITFAPLAVLRGKGNLRTVTSGGNLRNLVLSGLFNAVMMITHMLAMKLTNVAYMISVKRTSLLIGVLYGHLFFKEEKVGERMSGAVLMFAGFVLIVTAQ